MGLNRQPRSGGRGGAGRGRGGRGRHQHQQNAGASTVRSGMSVKHRDMLLDVLRHAATPGGDGITIDEKDLAIGPRSGGSAQITFQRNKAKTLLDHLQTALEVIGFPSAAASSLANDVCGVGENSNSSSNSSSLSTIFSLPQKDVSSYLDLIRHEPFVKSSEWELLDLCVAAAKKMAGIDNDDQDGTSASGTGNEGLLSFPAERHESRCCEWESFAAVYADHFVGNKADDAAPYLFDPTKNDDFANDDADDQNQGENGNNNDDDDGNDDDNQEQGKQQHQKDDDDENFDDDPESTVSLQFRTKGGDYVIVQITVSDDYPNRYPLFSVREKSFFDGEIDNETTNRQEVDKIRANSRIALGIPGSLRFSIFQALASIVVSFPKGMPLLQSLTSAAQEVIEEAKTWKEVEENESGAGGKKNLQDKHAGKMQDPKQQHANVRGEFLDKLIEATNALHQKQPQQHAQASGKKQQHDSVNNSTSSKNNSDSSISNGNKNNFSSSSIDAAAQKLTEVAPCLAPPTKLRQLEAQKSAEAFSRSTFLINDEDENRNMLCKWQEVAKRGALSAFRRTLPAYQVRDSLKSILAKSNVVLVCGSTGSGKTTQVPQYLLEYFIESGKASQCNIVCTQPRRIAASSCAIRVAEERDEQIGDTVGYSIRLESKLSKRSRLVFMTTGILLRRLQSDPYIGNISHVVVDEIHERGIDTDFLLILLKDLLNRRKDIKVVLMSATMDAKKFSDYFGGAPIVEIPGRTHPVRMVSLECALVATGYRLDEGSPFAIRDHAARGGSGKKNNRYYDSASMQAIADGIDESSSVMGEEKSLFAAIKEVKDACQESLADDPSSFASPTTKDDTKGSMGTSLLPIALRYNSISGKDFEGAARTLQTMDPDKINFELIEEIVLFIDRHYSAASANDDGNGAILIFLPGMAEITQCMEQLLSNRQISSRSLILNLHSTLGSGAQQAVFAKPPRGKRKIVLGTNIMETSVTIDDAVFVIDTGKFKENRYDARRALSQLVTCWVSKAAARQRQGRAGRVKPGLCFRLYSNQRYKSFADHQVCEMHRVPLENIILQIHALNLGDEVELLSRALDPPQRKAIEASIKVLSNLGALVKTEKSTQPSSPQSLQNQNQNQQQQQHLHQEHSLTSLGFHLTNLPIDVRIGKMIVLAAVLRCVDPVLTIAAALSGRNPFSSAPDDSLQVETIRRAFTRSNFSDFASSWFAYAGWLAAKRKKIEKQFVKDSFLSMTSLIGIQQTKKQLERYLVESGFLKQQEGASGVSEPHVTLDGTVYEIGGSFYNSNAASYKCITASIVGGLHPNIAKVLPPKKSHGASSSPSPSSSSFSTNRHFSNLVGCGTADGIIASIHPSSVNAKAMGEFPFPLVAYLEKIKTSTIFLRDTTVVSPYTLILFAGESKFHPEFEELAYDHWLSFRCCAADAALLLGLRRQLDAALASKINDPSSEWESVANVAVKAMVKLIHEESMSSLQLTTERPRFNRDPTKTAEGQELSKPSTMARSGGGGGIGGGGGGIGGGGDPSSSPSASFQSQQPKMSYGARMRLQSKTCFNCGDKGHLSRDCPNSSRKFPGGPTTNCFVCGSMSHHPTDCPLTLKRILPEGASATFGSTE